MKITTRLRKHCDYFGALRGITYGLETFLCTQLGPKRMRFFSEIPCRECRQCTADSLSESTRSEFFIALYDGPARVPSLLQTAACALSLQTPIS